MQTDPIAASTPETIVEVAPHQAPAEQRALGWLAAAAVLAIVWLTLPFAVGLLLGVLMAFALEPVYELLARRSGRPYVASILTVMASAVVIVGAFAGFVSLFVTRAVALANTIREELRPGGALIPWVNTATVRLGRFGISTATISARLESGAEEIAARFAGIAGLLASGTFLAVLGLFLALVAMHAVLRQWPQIVSALVVVSPLHPNYTRALLGEFRRVGLTTLSGTILTGLAQGVLATVGFFISGVPAPVFFGISTAIASLVPAVGTLLVWVPAGLYLAAIGHPAAAILELLWGALVVVGASDYVIRPRLVGGEAMPALLVFISLFGGLEVIGLSGLIVGPLVMSLAVAVLRLYAREQKIRRLAGGRLP